MDIQIIEVLILFSIFQGLIPLCIPSFQQCGCSHQQPIVSMLRIVGGYTAREHSWPWIVSIRRTDTHRSVNNPGAAFCGGTLINEKYVLTAAHCFYNVNQSLLSNYVVVIGGHYTTDINARYFKIKSIRLHEKYDDNLYLYDIALVELSCKINLNNSNIGLICLPSNNMSSIYPDEQMKGIVAGWGSLEENGSIPNALQQLQLPIISNKNQFCIEQISDDLIQFCAGFIQGGRDTCQGDSGGPLMIYDENTSTWHIAGITSYGYGCARAENLGVYTRVSMFVDWIDEHINSSSQTIIMQMSIKILWLLFFILLYF